MTALKFPLTSMQRIRLGQLLLIVVALMSLRGLNRVADYFQTPQPRIDHLSDYSQRFERVPELMPKDAVVGYHSDLSIYDERRINGLLKARYVLAPIAVLDTTATDWVLGDYSTEEAASRDVPPFPHQQRKTLSQRAVLWKRAE